MSTIAGLLEGRRDDDRRGLRADGAEWTWREVVAESAGRAALLGSIDLGVPAHVGVLLDNVPEYVFILGGAALAGIVVVGINPTRRGAELARDIRHADCKVVVTDREGAMLLDGLDLGSSCRVVAIDSPVWADLLAAHRGVALPDVLPEPDDLYLLLFTSGSTGAPKAVRVSQGRAARTAEASAVAFTSDDVLYCAMPLFHGNALFANFFPGLVSGATIVLRPRFSASAFLPDIRRYGCTYFNYIGRALSYVLAVPETPDERDNELRWGLGSEASPRDIREFRRRFGCPVIEGYGSSENAVVIQPVPGMPPGALGRPKLGLDVAIIDPVTEQECPAARFGADRRLLNPSEAIGEIVGRNGLTLFEGYYANLEADAARTRSGWYWTGDLGYRDEEGIFYFAGRTTDWLRVDGENFATAPVERILGRFPDVAAVAVYAVPDPRTGDQVMAAIEMGTGIELDLEAFAAFLATQPDLGTKWAPRYVRVVERLPSTATGKIDKQPLRSQGWSTIDPLWWRRAAVDHHYVRFTDTDLRALHRDFRESGRASTLDAIGPSASPH